MAPQRRLRVGDKERDAAIEALQEAHAAGRLSLDEFTERRDGALAARYDDDLAGLLDDLPEGEAISRRAAHLPASPRGWMPVPASAQESTTLTFMSGRDLMPGRGTQLLRDFAWWGGNNIHLRDAMGPGVTVVLELHAVMAGHTIYVPEGVRVLDESLAIMAGNTIKAKAQGDGSNGTLVIRGFLWWAGHTVELER